jgi:hypothetical protein
MKSLCRKCPTRKRSKMKKGDLAWLPSATSLAYTCFDIGRDRGCILQDRVSRWSLGSSEALSV